MRLTGLDAEHHQQHWCSQLLRRSSVHKLVSRRAESHSELQTHSVQTCLGDFKPTVLYLR